tara:strand:+ start:1683 stop:3590 length:1908 start_codon:yes stop_codon:yes gene_type:complete
MVIRWKIFFVPLVSLFFSFALLELGVRLLVPQNIEPGYVTDSMGIATLKPGFKGEFSNSLKINYDVNVNDKGIRRKKNNDYRKKDGKFRIVCVGDSETFGLGVGDSQTYPFYLEKILNESSGSNKFEVLNLGVSSWGPVEYYRYLKMEGLKYSPDIIVLGLTADDKDLLRIDSFNYEKVDFIEKENGLEIHVHGIKFFSSEKPLIFQGIQYIFSHLGFEWLIRHSHSLNLFRKRLTLVLKTISKEQSGDQGLKKLLSNLKGKSGDLILHSGQIAIEVGPVLESDVKSGLFNLYLRKIEDMAKQNKIKLYFLRLPNLWEVFNVVKIDYGNFRWKYAHNLEILQDFKVFNKKNETSLFMLDDLHYTPGGNLLVAYLLFNRLKSISAYSPFLISEWDVGKEIVREIARVSRDYDTAIKSSIRWFFYEGLIEDANGMTLKAKEKLLKYLKVFGNDHRAYKKLGMIFMKEGNTVESIDYFLKANKLQDNKDADILFFLAKAYFELKQFDKSLEYLTLAEVIGGKLLPEVYNYFAMNEHRRKHFQSAEKYWLKAIAGNPLFSQYHRSLGSLYFDLQNYEKAVWQFEVSLRLSPNEPKVYLLCALGYAFLKNKTKAKEMFRKVLLFEPKNQIAKTGLMQLSG